MINNCTLVHEYRCIGEYLYDCPYLSRVQGTKLYILTLESFSVQYHRDQSEAEIASAYSDELYSFYTELGYQLDDNDRKNFDLVGQKWGEYLHHAMEYEYRLISEF